jgi:hypothetical protein
MSDDIVDKANLISGSAVLPTISFGVLDAEILMRKMKDRIEELEAKLTIAMVGLVQSRDALDLYSQHEYSSDTAYERYRQRDYDANPARIALAKIKGESHEL